MIKTLNTKLQATSAPPWSLCLKNWGWRGLKVYLANWRDVLGGAAGSVVASVRQAGEHLGVPGRADHHVGHADPVQLARVAELVEAPGTQRFGC